MIGLISLLTVECSGDFWLVILILSNGTINRKDIILNVFAHACVYTYNKFVLIEMELI